MFRKAKLPLESVILHWLLVISLVISLLSGLRISSDLTQHAWLSAFDRLLPDGNVFSLHLISAMLLTTAFVTYLLLLLRKSNFSRIRLSKTSSHKLVFYNRLVIWLGLLLLLFALMTGWCKFFSIDCISQPQLDKFHFYLAWVLMIYFVAHLLMQMSGGIRKALGNIFLTGSPTTIWLATSSLIIVTVLGWWMSEASENTLNIKRVTTLPKIDGNPDDAVWQQVPSITVKTKRGANLEDGYSNVSVQAVHDDTMAYFLFSWEDQTRSMKHLPLQKTAEGWRILQTEAGIADEDSFYEDKFAVMLSRDDHIAGAGSIHLGSKPFKDSTVPFGGRGYHATTNNEIVDIWHWKAVRTGLSIGQADDNYFGPKLPSRSEIKRYTSGYQKDPDCEHLLRWEGNDYHLRPDCGGYIMNWKEYSDGIIQPRRLPKDPRTLQILGDYNLDPQQSDQGQWWLPWESTIRYSIEKDNYPVGTVIPSVISLGPFKKDRGDVKAGAQWHNGTWNLELSRSLEVTSKYDLPIADDTYLWVSVFDHAQTRHTWHLKPIPITVE